MAAARTAAGKPAAGRIGEVGAPARAVRRDLVEVGERGHHVVGVVRAPLDRELPDLARVREEFPDVLILGEVIHGDYAEFVREAGVDSATDLVGSLALLFVALSAGAAGLSTVGTLSAEEAEGRLGLVASTRVPLRTWWPAWGAVALAGAGAVLLGGAAVLGVATALATGRGAEVGSALAAGAGYLIPVAVIVLVGLASRAATVRPARLGWVVLAWAGIVGLLAETLRLPGWARDLSPLHAVGTLPIDAPDVTATVVLGALAVVLGAAAPALAARRDLAAG